MSLTISFSVVLIGGFCGSILGMFAGYYKKMELVVMCVMDGLMALPSLLLAMALVAVLGTGIDNMVIALTISNLPRIVRTVRATVISVKNLDYVEAARSMGASDGRIMWKYIFPECISPLIVRLTMTMAFVILEEASLTFLGLGLSPETASWGIILNEARKYVRTSPYFLLIPGTVVVTAVYCINTLGDGLRDWLDPKIRY
ncbi:MAG: ABC transporter permease [Acidaminococcales bacterium]|nr:ABC transporter permease [Acidaminococcales bacterium]